MKNPVNWFGVLLLAFLAWWNLLEIPWRRTIADYNSMRTIPGTLDYLPIGAKQTERAFIDWPTLSATLLYAAAIWLMCFAALKLAEAAWRATAERRKAGL